MVNFFQVLFLHILVVPQNDYEIMPYGSILCDSKKLLE